VIAATALVHDCALVTGTRAIFPGYAMLEIVNRSVGRNNPGSTDGDRVTLANTARPREETLILIHVRPEVIDADG
jgi:hypothetical protein